MKRSYLDYAMSVIVSRALPGVRDGLKPVHRRILYAMRELNFTPDRPYNKSARTVGDVIGKYHPHGELAVYDALVRMAQDFSMSAPLIDGQGNFGSVDGDPPAAQRYTEARLAPVSLALLEDLDKDAVDFKPNYDEKETEPVVLPARFPNLLVNGAGGIAVGMATNIPPHNLGEVIDGLLALMDKPEITLEELLEHIPGPDFPTGGAILGRAGIRSAYATGRGSIIMRAKVAVEELRKDREALIVNEIPYQVNKATLIERMAELVREKRVEGISDLRDESDRDGMRIVIEIKRDAVAEVVLNQLWRFTALQSSFGANMIALNGGRPEMLTLTDMLRAFLDFREEVVTRRTKYLLTKARDNAHIQVGLAIAVANIDEVIRLIRTSPDSATARTALIELRLARLTALGRDEIAEALNRLAVEIADYLDILGSRLRLMTIIREELVKAKTDFATPRRTIILDSDADMEDEDLIQREDMVVLVSHGGYIKRAPLSTYRAQRRGGKGRGAMATRDEDFVARLFVASTHQPVLFFSSRGQAYKEKVWRLPLAAPQARGKAMINILPLMQDERITTIMPLPEDESSWANLDVMFATTRGTVRRNKLSDFVDVGRSGMIPMKLDDGEAIVDVQICTDKDDVLLTTAIGQCIRFAVDEVRVFTGRTSMGVRGIALDAGDTVISLSILRHVDATSEERAAYLKRASAVRRGLDDTPEEAVDAEPDLDEATGAIELGEQRYVDLSTAEQFVLTISERGYGKRTSSFEYRTTGRGGKGIVAMDNRERDGTLRAKIGRLVASFPVEEADQLMLVTTGGQLIRCEVADIGIKGRKTRGVIVFNTADDERVVSVERVSEEGETNGNGEGSGE